MGIIKDVILKSKFEDNCQAYKDAIDQMIKRVDR
jgi:hypothetical protein